MKGIWYFLTSPDSTGTIPLELVVGVVMVMLLGGYCIYLALKLENVIKFKTIKSSESFATHTLSQKGELEPLITYLNQKKSVIRE